MKWEYGEYDVYFSKFTDQWEACPPNLTPTEKAVWGAIADEGGWSTYHLYGVCRHQFPEREVLKTINDLFKRGLLYHTPAKKKLKANTDYLPLFVDPQPSKMN